MSEKLNELRKSVRQIKDEIGPYGMHIRIDIDTENEGDEGEELYVVTLNDELFSDALTAGEAYCEVHGIYNTFKSYSLVSTDDIIRMLRDRETTLITDLLDKCEGGEYAFFDPNADDEEDEWENCPVVLAQVDEWSVTDTSFHELYVHEVEKDGNGNIKLTGRVVQDGYPDGERVYTYLGSVLPFYLEKVRSYIETP